MKNVKLTLSPDKKSVSIEVDLTQDFGKSASGKTIIIASTEGNVVIEGTNPPVTVGLNIYKK